MPDISLAVGANVESNIVFHRFDETARAYRKKLDIDPRGLMSVEGMGYPAMYEGRYDEAIGWCRKALEIDPNFAVAYSDLATLYGVETKALNRAVRRNLGRFPADFMFQLTLSETTG